MCIEALSIRTGNYANRSEFAAPWDSGICRQRSRQAGACDAAPSSSHRTGNCAPHVKTGYEALRKRESPCLTCTRVKNPSDCENKNCRVWRAWFTESWERVRMNPRLQKEKDRSGLEGVTICGRTYLLPDKVRQYLKTSPCKTCPMPEYLCTSPCPAYRTWQETRKEVSV